MNSPLVNQLRANFKDSRILVLGMGREGLSTAKLLLEQGIGQRVSIADQKPFDSLVPQAKALIRQYEIRGYWGDAWLEKLSEFDVIFRSPGVSPFAPEFQSHRTSDQLVTSQAREFLRAYGSQTIGVTGTKGKSTTASLIYTCLKKYFPQTIFLGNIGTPAFEASDAITPNTTIVFELSSHQLLGTATSPHQAVVLNLYQEHLDYYPTMSEYIEAKAQIVVHQTKHDIAYLADDQAVTEHFAHRGKGEKRLFSTASLSNQATSWLSAHPGINPISLAAVLAISRQAGLSEDQVLAALAGFVALSHRFEQVGTHAGRICINDSLATIPEATIAALTALAPQSGCLIVGGFDRGQSFSSLANKIQTSNFHTIIGLPDTGWTLIDVLLQKPGKTCIKVADLREAVVQAFAATKSGEIILLSPAAASFNAFTDYAQRGEAFKTLVVEMSAS